MATAAASFVGPCSPLDADGTLTLPQFHRRLMPSTDVPLIARNGGAVDVVIPPGVAESPHTHLRPSFMLVDSPTAITVTLVDVNGTRHEVFRRDEAITVLERESRDEVMEPEPLHFVTNLQGDRALRAVRFEFDDLVDDSQPEYLATLDWSALTAGVEVTSEWRLRWRGVAFGWRIRCSAACSLHLAVAVAGEPRSASMFVVEEGASSSLLASVSLMDGDEHWTAMVPTSADVAAELLQLTATGHRRPRVWCARKGGEGGSMTVATASTLFVVALLE